MEKRCPICNSDNLSVDKTSDFMISFFVTRTPYPWGIAKHRFICRDCGYQWDE